MKRLCIAFIFLCVTTPFLQAEGLRVLYIGDSITDGNWGGGGAKPSDQRNHWDWNHLFGSGYMYLCAAHYMGNYPEREYVFFNRGISGNTLNDLVERWDTDALALKPDVLTILVGINDVIHYLNGDQEQSFDFEAWETTYRALIDRTLAACPEVKIVLGAPFVTPTGNMRTNPKWKEYKQMTRRCAAIVTQIAGDYKTRLLSFQPMFDQLLTTYSDLPDTYWIWDGIHPTPAGHQRMANLWIEQADDLLREIVCLP